jgi:hypothetical protein
VNIGGWPTTHWSPGVAAATPALLWVAKLPPYTLIGGGATMSGSICGQLHYNNELYIFEK